MKKFRPWLPFAGALAAVIMVSNLSPAQAQTAATVTVNASSSIATIPPAAFGVNVGCGDGEMVGPNVTAALKSAGISALRYPGGGSAQLYGANKLIPYGVSPVPQSGPIVSFYADR
jgi:hypothetical protein